MPDPISTTVFPGDAMSPGKIGTAASMIRYVGDDVSSRSADVVSTWGTLAESYTAPESGTLLAAMDPLATSGTTFDTNVTSAAGALETFAEEVRAIKKTLEGIRADANAFLGTIHGGKVTATVYGNNEGQTRTEEKAWNDDPATASKNNELLGQVEAQAALLRAAEQKCANAILAVVDPGGRRGENGGPGLRVGPAPAVENPPWGVPVDFPELLDDPVGRGLKKVFADTVQGAASLAGFDTSHYRYDLDDTRGSDNLAPIFSNGWSLANSWHTVVGIGKVANGLNPLAPALALVPGWYGQQFRDGQAASRDFLKSQVAWDDWRKHPGEAATETAVNLATIVLAVAKVGAVGKAGAAGRAGTEASEAATASKAAEAASAARRLSEVGRGVGTKVAMPTLDGIKALAKAPENLYRSVVDKLHVKVDVPDRAVHVDRATHPVHDVPKTREPEVSSASHARDHTGPDSATTRTHADSAPTTGLTESGGGSGHGHPGEASSRLADHQGDTQLEDRSRTVTRGDNDFYSKVNERNVLKSHLDDDGSLVPASVDGQASQLEHVGGRMPAKADSPYTSFVMDSDRALARNFGKDVLHLDLAKPESDIAAGRVHDVSVVRPEELQHGLRTEIESVYPDIDLDRVLGNPSGIREYVESLNISGKQSARLRNRLVALNDATRWNEVLIKGKVSAIYLTVPGR